MNLNSVVAIKTIEKLWGREFLVVYLGAGRGVS